MSESPEPIRPTETGEPASVADGGVAPWVFLLLGAIAIAGLVLIVLSVMDRVASGRPWLPAVLGPVITGGFVAAGAFLLREHATTLPDPSALRRRILVAALSVFAVGLGLMGLALFLLR